MRDFSQARLRSLLQRPDTTWRHDVDVDLEAALKMAELEYRLGVKATYYIMARSPYYNPFSPSGQQALRKIKSLGHDLGHHIDLNLPRDARPFDRDVDIAVRDSARLLEIGSRKVSFHCPPESLLWRDRSEFESAYALRWKGRYYADSRGMFAHGDPEDADGHIQVNLHPEHWFPEHEGFWR